MPSEGEDPSVREGRQAFLEAVVDGDAGEVMVVQAGATQVPILQIEPEGTDEMKVCPRSRAHPDRISRVWRDNGVLENDMGER